MPRSHPPQPPDPTGGNKRERLQKVLAAAGLGSRRACETLIESGRVLVNDEPAKLGMSVDPAQDIIRLDGEPLQVEARAYYLAYKPISYLCTNADEMGRDDKLAIQLVPEAETRRLFTVGRLDKDSEGLILITNDGAFAQELSHPKHQIPKKYRVTVRGFLQDAVVRQLLEGVRLAEGWAKADAIDIRKRTRKNSVLDITLREGKNREIRRLMAKVEHPVSRLVRIAIGTLTVGGMKPGDIVALTAAQAREFLADSQKLAAKPSPKRPSKQPRIPSATATKSTKRQASETSSATPRPRRSAATASPRSRDGKPSGAKKTGGRTTKASSHSHSGSTKKTGGRAGKPFGAKKTGSSAAKAAPRPRAGGKPGGTKKAGGGTASASSRPRAGGRSVGPARAGSGPGSASSRPRGGKSFGAKKAGGGARKGPGAKRTGAAKSSRPPRGKR